MKAQNVFLTLSDGREIMGTVPAFISSESEEVRVMSIRVSRPYDLPEGHEWSPLALEYARRQR